MNPRIGSVAAGASLGIALVVRLTERIPVFAPDGPWLVSSLPPLGASLLLAGGGAALGGLIGRYVGEGRTRHFLGLGLAAAALIPGVFSVAPSLALFSGRALDFLLAAAAFTVLADAWLHAARGSGGEVAERRAVTVVAALSFVALLAAGLKMNEDVGFSGDEPHYLLITHSLVTDGDLRVQNNYAQEDYLLFYRGKIGPHLSAGTEYSIHGVALPIALAPGYAAFGVAGVLASLAAFGALLVASAYLLARRSSDSHVAGLLAAGSFTATMPGLFLSVSAYPELLAACIVTAVSARLYSSRGFGKPSALAWTLLVGALPFLHMKFVPLAGLLWAALAIATRRRAAVAGGAAMGAVLLMAFFYSTTGSIDPTASYGRQRVFVESIPTGLLGLLFDQEFGLLVFAPFYLVGIAGLVSLARRRPWLAALSVGVLFAVALPGAAHPLWSGGNSPPARFLFPALPVLAAAAAVAWRHEPRVGVTQALPALLGASLAVSSFAMWLPGQPLYLNQKDGTGRLWEELSSSWELTAYLPSIVRADPRSFAWAGVAVLLVAVAVAAAVRKRALWLPPLWLALTVFLVVQDVTGVAISRALEGRWVSRLFRELSSRELDAFVAVPGFEGLDVDGLSARVPLPLVRQVADGDPRSWWSHPYAIPAGRYTIEGVEAGVWSPCNEQACFEPEGLSFETSVSWARFRLRARRVLLEEPRLRLVAPGGKRPVAERSLSLGPGARLHGLDDEAYLDRRGFWVKQGARAGFVVEGDVRLELHNGGRPNVVVVESSHGVERVELRPWQSAPIPLPPRSGERFDVTSESGFRPADLDPDSTDRRPLGVLVTAPRL